MHFWYHWFLLMFTLGVVLALLVVFGGRLPRWRVRQPPVAAPAAAGPTLPPSPPARSTTIVVEKVWWKRGWAVWLECVIIGIVLITIGLVLFHPRLHPIRVGMLGWGGGVAKDMSSLAPVGFLLLFALAVGAPFAAYASKGYARAGLVVATVVLWGLVFTSRSYYESTLYWPFGSATSTHVATATSSVDGNSPLRIGVMPVDLRQGARHITWHVEPGKCVDIYNDGMKYLARDCAGQFTDLREKSPTYFAASGSDWVVVTYTTW